MDDQPTITRSLLKNARRASTRLQRGVIPEGVFRSADASLEVAMAVPATDIHQLVEAVRDYWVVLREMGLADANPVKVLADASDLGAVVWVFRWKTSDSRARAAASAECVRAAERIEEVSEDLMRVPFAHELYQGFEHRRFPPRGGVELLRGKCTCTVQLDGFDVEFELEGQNGFVIMHRGPGLEQNGVRIMPVTIYQHGADMPSPLASLPQLKDAPEEVRTAPLRVEQNTDLPQFGVIRALEEESDFPAVAMWVVHWRVQTPIGTLITDPAQPLVFGPTTVQHYPPVGTEFFSAVGPVDVLQQPNGNRVGTLTPGQLTAFDIVVTIDDETMSLHDRPALYHVEMFNRYVGDRSLEIPTTGLVNDHRVPEKPTFGEPPKRARQTRSTRSRTS